MTGKRITPTARGNQWSDEDDATLRRMWMEGAHVSAIGRAVRRSRQAVYDRREKIGLPGRKLGEDFVSDRRKAIVEDRGAGMTFVQIAAKHHVSRSSIRKILASVDGKATHRTNSLLMEERAYRMRAMGCLHAAISQATGINDVAALIAANPAGVETARRYLDDRKIVLIPAPAPGCAVATIDAAIAWARSVGMEISRHDRRRTWFAAGDELTERQLRAAINDRRRRMGLPVFEYVERESA